MAKTNSTGRTPAATPKAPRAKATKNTTAPTPEASEGTAPTAWDNVPDMDGLAPWKHDGLTTAEMFTMLAKEAKACLYELLRAHVEIHYDRSGWPADPKAWEPLERERDAVVGTAELQPGERYGLTYGAVRWSSGYVDGPIGPIQEPRKLIPLQRLTIPGHPPLNLLWVRWTGEYFSEELPENKTIPALLQRHQYAEELKEEIRTAFADFAAFEIGHGAGSAFMDRLQGDEQGRNAIASTEQRHKELSGRVDALLDEPFGIERDFTHLFHAACETFGKVLLQQREQKWEQLGSLLNDHDLRHFTQKDILGEAPNGTYNAACTGPDGTIVPFRLDRWVTIYLERVNAIANRWRDKGHPGVDGYLDGLREQVCTWDRAAWGVDALPQHRTDVEAATRNVLEGIEKEKGTPVDGGQAQGIPWRGSTQVLAWLLRELAEKGWIDAPRHRSTTQRYKAGDINASKYARAMVPHFQGTALVTLERELKPEGGTVPAQDVEGFAIPQRPE